MNSRRAYMRRSSFLAAAAMVLLAGGCELDIENPNAPDAPRAFADPAGLEQLITGAFRTWVETRGDYFGSLPMTAMADNYTASWNNAAIRYYSSVGSDCPQRCGWNNSATAPEAAGGPSVESQWYGYYTVLSSANDVMSAIDAGVCFDDDCDADNTLTSRNRAIAQMLQGMAFAGIALNYDQGFIVDENTDLTSITTLPFNTREEVRDAALAKFDAAYTEAGTATWTTGDNWFGVGSGTDQYSNTQIQRLIRTMQAELVALFPRDGGEKAAADWAAVATYASQGISSGTTPFSFEYYVDGSSVYLDYVKTWGNSIGTMRVDTRFASQLASNHVHPWPEAAGGNPCPTVSSDRRVGDGSWGPVDDFNGYATVAATANAGSDFACSGVAIFPPARGQYHQSNLAHVRYEFLGYEGENLGGNSTGWDPLYTPQMNDLLWAEGELRRAGGNLAVAATRINNSRIGRGSAGCTTPGVGGCGFLPLTAASGQAAMLAALLYEQEIEFMGQGPTTFYIRRGVDGLQPATPFHMPVPAKEMDVLVRASYTFGGPGAPQKMVASAGRETVRQRWLKSREVARTATFLKQIGR